MIINSDIMEKTINERLVEVLKHLKENKLIYNEAYLSPNLQINISAKCTMKVEINLLPITALLLGR